MPEPQHLAPRSPVEARRRQVGAALVALVVLVAIAVGVTSARGSEQEAGADAPTMTASPTTGTLAKATPTKATATSPPPTTPKPTSPKPTKAKPTKPTYRTTGRWSRVATGTPVRGRSGEVLTYRVEVEQGSGVAPRRFAAFVDETLRHRRGWTAGGQWRFQRVTSAQPDVTIRLATPRSVDTLCAAAGADTDGYTSCRAGSLIMLNLDRWYLGVPHVADLTTYRHYLVNHEVGHALGLGHQACPGRGRPAPVMLQQTLHLDGCTPNAWPRSASGREITGPATP